jgi:vancomycin resistance protein YoaR
VAFAVTAGAYGARTHYLPSGVTLPGLKIDGAPVSGDVRAFVEARARQVGERRVKLVVEGDEGRVLSEASLAELGVRVDVDRAVAVAMGAGHSGDVLERAEATKRARKGLMDVPLEISVDFESALPVLARIKEAEDSSPVSARVDLDHHTVIPERLGRYIAVDGALAAIVRAADDPTQATVTLPIATYAPRVSRDLAEKLDIHAVLGAYETYFSRKGDQLRRGKNIDVAAAKLDGLVISPGELVSFNDIVGDRSEENGFEKSWEIYKGEMVEGVGGGTCQVASTFFATIFFGGLDVIERLPHSRPSAYIPMGLDSTVVYPIVDLKVRNPHPFPVVVHARTEGNKLKMELLGAQKLVKVSFHREIVDSVPYPRKVTEDPKLTGNHVVMKQHGIRGFHIKRERILKYIDGTEKKEKNTDFYPPTTEIYEVPEGFDEALLPPLPEPGADEDGDAGVAPGAPADAGAAASAVDAATPPPAGPPPAVPQAGPGAPDVGIAGLEMSEAPGAHAPTQAQRKPTKEMWLRR